MGEATEKTNRKKFLWAAKIVLAVGLCWLVLHKTHLKDKLEIRERSGETKVLWGRLIKRTQKGDWLWQNPNGTEIIIDDKQVIRKTNGAGNQEASFEQGLVGLAATAYGNGWAWLGVGLFPSMIFLAAWRWQRLLRAGRVKISYRKVLMLTVMGNFFNNALPSMIGGDVVKVYYVMKSHPKRKSHVAIAWVADRVSGIAGLAIICLIAIAVGWQDPLVQEIRGPVFMVAGLLALGLTVLFVPGLAGKMHLGKLLAKLPFQSFVDQLRKATRLYSAQPGVWVLAVGLSVCVHMILLSCIYLGGRALAPGPSYHSYLVLLPPVLMISSLPITPGAVGWMETSYQTLFARAGVSGTAALSLSLFHRFARLLWSLPGLAFYIKGPQFKVNETAVKQVDQILDGQTEGDE
ncbi:MAG: flippase-like domain-containing protein [Actinobacteria bacterium]|nr:flippase-like domain-containing protein [Actinomycetota bacterium]